MENTENKIENIVIKKVKLGNINELQLIGIKTFQETFAAGNTEEDMQMYLNESFSTQKLTQELTNGNTEFYFVVNNDEIIGYLKVNFMGSQTELKYNKSLEIERIYVAKEFYGKKVGQMLYEKAVQIAKKINAEYIWLGVWEKNLRALSFYRKNGFVAFDKHIFKLGNDNQTDIMMKVILKN